MTGRGRPKLGEVTSVRLRPHPHEVVRRLAELEEIDVTEWIRRVIDKEIAQREGRCPTCGQVLQRGTSAVESIPLSRPLGSGVIQPDGSEMRMTGDAPLGTRYGPTQRVRLEYTEAHGGYLSPDAKAELAAMRLADG